jgi:L-fuconolactonase
MSLFVDAHQHFWTYGTYQTSWMEVAPYAGDPAFQSLRRSFLPDDLAPELKAAGIRYAVTIEAADGLQENAALLANAQKHDWIAGVVGWMPIAHPNELERVLDELVDRRALVGVRHLINVEPDLPLYATNFCEMLAEHFRAVFPSADQMRRSKMASSEGVDRGGDVKC